MNQAPEGLRLRGRNGHSDFKQFQVFGSPEKSWLELYSGRVGRMPPAQIVGPAAALLDVLETAADEVRGVLDSKPSKLILYRFTHEHKHGTDVHLFRSPLKRRDLCILKVAKELGIDYDSTEETIELEAVEELPTIIV